MKKLIVIQNIEREGPGLFSKIAYKKGFITEICNLSKGEALPQFSKNDLILIMGGPMGLEDINKKNYSWLKKEIEFIKNVIDNEIPIIGVCLGAQLIAHVMGGSVEKLKILSNKRYKTEIGWSEIFSSKSNKLNKLNLFLRDPLYVLHWHMDRILLPSNADLLASSNFCREQLFKIGDKIFGLQFHAETEPFMTNNWINEDKKFIISALGKEGQSILNNQCKDFELKSLNKRILFINILLDTILKS